MIALVFSLLLTITLSCPDNCSDCFANSPFCLACTDGYQLSLSSTCLNQDLMPHCARFINATHCNACQPTFTLLNNACVKDFSGCLSSDSNSGQCSACGFGTVLRNGSCVGSLQCKQQSQNCRECREGWVLRQGRCMDSTGRCSDLSEEGVCLKCKQGFRLVGFECLDSSVQVPNCFIFTGQGECQICKDGYSYYQGYCFLSEDLSKIYSGLFTAQQLITNRSHGINSTADSVGCLSLSTDGSCLQCQPGYYLRHRSCLPLSPFCTSYNQSTGLCLTCMIGFILLNDNCSDPHCLLGEAGNCSLCENGFTPSGNPSICAPNANNSPNNTINSCVEYDWSGVCLRCLAGFQVNEGNCVPEERLLHCAQFSNLLARCASCQEGFELTVNYTCQPAPRDINCLLFQNGRCVNCSHRYFYSPAGGKCLPVNSLCQYYSQMGNCTSCYPGYHLLSGSCIIAPPIEANCQETSPTSTCTKCYSGYYLADGKCHPYNPLCKSSDPTNGNCTSCYPGYSISNGRCQVARTDPNCNQTTNNGSCLSCYTSFYLDSVSGRCKQVSSLCKGADSNGNCLDCYPGYRLSSGQCTVAQQIYNCFQASNGACQRCYSGYYLTASGACAQANPLCKTYAKLTGVCTSCYPGYSLLQGQCSIAGPGSSASSNCASYDSSNTCLACFKGYYLTVSGSCSKVSDLCRSHDNSTGICTSCYEGYQLTQDGGCLVRQEPQDSNCIAHSGPMCTKCAAGFYLKPDNQCALANPLCRQMDPYNQCTSCYQGYNLENHQCVLSRPIYLPYCLDQSGSLCTECMQNYYLKNGQCTSVSILCSSYDRLTGECLSCIEGYVLQQRECIRPSLGIDPNCAIYSGSFCSSCRPGFRLLNYWCVAQDSNCLQFEAISGSCLACRGQLTPSGASCT